PGATFAAHHHAGYVRSLDDLRSARALLNRAENVSTAEGSQDEVSLAIGNIDGAIAEISKEAPMKDIKGTGARKVDARMTWAARLSASMRLLDRARLDCSSDKDDAANAGLQARVFASIDHAHDRIRVAIDTVNFDYSARNMPTRND
ncbi:MAG TPA: hypothetical protein VHS08_08015, partial [Candidatus Acidoferrales bacterium]|nr:hypothetical protein [Candidatus Acidoferrales bacterium]